MLCGHSFVWHFSMESQYSLARVIFGLCADCSYALEEKISVDHQTVHEFGQRLTRCNDPFSLLHKLSFQWPFFHNPMFQEELVLWNVQVQRYCITITAYCANECPWFVAFHIQCSWKLVLKLCLLQQRR